MSMRDVAYSAKPATPVTALSTPTIWLGRVSGGVVIFLMLLDGAIRFVPWPIVTETMDRMGYGSSESLARFLGIISLIGTALCAFSPTSFVGAIVTTGYLASALVSHVRIESTLSGDLVSALNLCAVLFAGLRLRDRGAQMLFG